MFENNKIHLGIAPIGWSNDDMPELGRDNTFEQCISEIALAGFEGTEVGVKFPENSDTLKKYLEIRGLRIASQWFSSYLCSSSYEENEKEFMKTLDFLEKLGANRINVCELTHCLFAAKIFGKRIRHVHLKDIRKEKMEEAIDTGFGFRKSVLEGCFTIPGDGMVDFESILKIVDDCGYEGWLIVEAEQNPVIANPFENALRARQFIKKLIHR